MIHHISIAVENPHHVAQVLAEVWNGQVFPFPPNPGSYVVLPMDAYGTMIELYPATTELIPGKDAEPVEFSKNIFSSPHTAVHAAISLSTSQAQIEAIGQREGWRTVRCNRGPFDVIEFWVENTLMLELLPPELADRYLAFMQPQSLAQFFVEAAAEPEAAELAPAMASVA